LQYASRWADILEGLRRHSEETDATLLPTTSAGPLAEIQRVLGEAREFVEGLAVDTNGEGTADYRLPISETQEGGVATLSGRDTMAAKVSGEEIGRRGQEIYESRLRTLLETEESIGKIVSIDVESGDYEIGDDLVTAGRRLQMRRPDARMYGKRIGYNAVYAVGGSLTRTAQRGTRG